MAAAFEQIGKHHLVEALGDVDRLIINSVSDGMLLDVGSLVGHLFPILVGYFSGIDFQLAACFEVDEFGGTVGKGELDLLCKVEGVEKDNLVFAMAQVT